MSCHWHMETEAKLTALMILVALDVARGCTIEERRELAGMLIGIAEQYEQDHSTDAKLSAVAVELRLLEK
jgi:hypothetical protein